MFERFSSGYYLGELYVEPHGGERAVIQRADHEHVNEQLYADGEGVERLDAPLVMKVGGGHIPVAGDDDVPSGTLAIPQELADEISAAAGHSQESLNEAFAAYDHDDVIRRYETIYEDAVDDYGFF